MKCLFFPLVLLMACACAQTDSGSLPKYFGIKTVKIVYKFTNGPQSGEKIIIFDDWGRKEREEVVTNNDTVMFNKALSAIRQMMDSMPHSPIFDSAKQSFQDAVPAVQHNLRIRDSGKVYSIDLDKNTCHVTQDTQLLPDSGFFGQPGARSDTLLGRPCKVVDFQNAFRIWYWKKIPVKKEVIQHGRAMGVIEYAISFDEGYKAKPDDFKIPPSVKMQ
jgi:hypothetical protein